MIKKENNKYVIYSKDGKKKLGEFDTEKDAKKRLREIEYFKHKKTAMKDIVYNIFTENKNGQITRD